MTKMTLQKVLPPATEVVEASFKPSPPAQSTPLTGFALSTFIRVLELSNKIFAPDLGPVQTLRGLRIPEAPLYYPNLPTHDLKPEPGCAVLQASNATEAVRELVAGGFLPHVADAWSGPTPAAGAGEGDHKQAEGAVQAFRRPTVADYVWAYRTGATNPTQVAERILSFLSTDVPGNGWFIAQDPADFRAQAAASTARWQEGKPLSVLDGVPYTIKDVIDALPYQTTAGTAFLAEQRPVQADSPLVKSLRALGALLIGKSAMHEIGMGGTGINLRTGTALNPYDYPHRMAGGSSSGCAAAVAAGLCPFAIGTDGGGSIRGPASWSGIVGLKPTNGRISIINMWKVDCSVGSSGPMAATVTDAILLHAVIANFDAGLTKLGTPLPALRLPNPLPYKVEVAGALTGAKAGIYWDWFNDATPEVVAVCKEAVEVLKAAGVEISDVKIPEIQLMRAGHAVTIASEMSHNHQAFFEHPATRALFNPDVRLSLTKAKLWDTADYVTAQRVRARGDIHYKRLFETVDVLVLPVTAIPAPKIPAGALTGGLVDTGLARLGGFTGQANFLGLPALSVPVGTDAGGLPIGLQLVGRPWQEGTLLRYAAVLEAEYARRAAAKSAGGSEAATSSTCSLPVAAGEPRVWLDPLTGAKRGA